MNDNGQITSLSQYKDGKLDGMGIGWYGNGQKKLENAHKDGKLITAFSWKANGEKCPVTNVVDGNGVWVWYNLAGQKFWSLTYKDGVKVDAKLGEGVKHLTD